MSLHVYTIRAIRCDRYGCDEEFEGTIGASAKQVREEATEEGWLCGFLREDRCPKHGEEMRQAGGDGREVDR